MGIPLGEIRESNKKFTREEAKAKLLEYIDNLPPNYKNKPVFKLDPKARYRFIPLDVFAQVEGDTDRGKRFVDVCWLDLNAGKRLDYVEMQGSNTGEEKLNPAWLVVICFIIVVSLVCLVYVIETIF